MPVMAEVDGSGLIVIITSSVELQGPFEIVHLKVTEVPATSPVTVEVEDEGVVIVAAPVTTVHAPVPVIGALPVSAVEVVSHSV